MLSVLVGTNVQIKSTLTDADTGSPIDPVDVTFFIGHAPPSTQIDPYTFSGGQVMRVSAGVYKVIVQVTTVGTWSWSMKGANGQGRDAGLVNVIADPDYS